MLAAPGVDLMSPRAALDDIVADIALRHELERADALALVCLIELVERFDRLAADEGMRDPAGGTDCVIPPQAASFDEGEADLVTASGLSRRDLFKAVASPLLALLLVEEVLCPPEPLDGGLEVLVARIGDLQAAREPIMHSTLSFLRGRLADSRAQLPQAEAAYRASLAAWDANPAAALELAWLELDRGHTPTEIRSAGRGGHRRPRPCQDVVRRLASRQPPRVSR
jgi:hypothetical protein